MTNVLKYVWQLPQHIVALLILCVFHKKIKQTYTYESSHVFVLDWLFGVSLGTYILISPLHTITTIKHEYGHSKQSLYLGPLYLLVIGIPSIVMNLVSTVSSDIAKNYYKRFPENWADKLGNVNRK